MIKQERVLHIVDSLGLGGAQILIKGIFEAEPLNTDLYLFALRRKGITIEIQHPHVNLFGSKKKFSFAPLKTLRQLVVEKKITILHCHLFRSQFFGYLLKRLWFKEIKLLFHEHGRVLRGGLMNRLFLFFTKEHVDAYIAVSEAAKDCLVRTAGINPSAVKVLYNFIETKKFNRSHLLVDSQVEKNRLGVADEDFVIGFIGRLDEVKGCEYLIRALPLLDFAWKLVIAGDGVLKTKLQNLAKDLGLSDRVLFLGFLSDPVPFYGVLDMLVVPSVSESFGLSAVEAQAMQVPVAASRVGGLKEVIDDLETGLLFTSEDPSDIAKKITLLKSDADLRDALRKRAYIKAQNYRLDIYLESVITTYKKLYE